MTMAARVAEVATQLPVILASASKTRAALLRSAGVAAAVEPARIDESEVKQGLRAVRAAPSAMAESLAELKAQRVSRRHRNALVIGADQVLSCGGEVFDKPITLTEARRQLLALRGRRHELASAVVLVRDGQRLWHHVGQATLMVREFSEAFLDRYLDLAGEEVLASVGAYRLEGLGIQLFAGVDGDYFTVLGLPLLPLLDVLREHGVLLR
jgi:septum formation protein